MVKGFSAIPKVALALYRISRKHPLTTTSITLAGGFPLPEHLDSIKQPGLDHPNPHIKPPM